MKLTPQHYRAIELIAMGSNNKNVAERLDIAPETVSRWKSDYDFRAKLNEMLQEQHAATQKRLRALAGSALSAIESIISSTDALERDRLTAAFKILEMTQVKLPRIGSTNPRALQRDDEMTKALDEFNL